MAVWLTQQDVQDYGPDVLDFAQRAALHALQPELQRVNEQNASLGRQLAVERRRALYQALDQRMPAWRDVDNDPQFIAWLHGIHALTGLPRQRLLDAAVMEGD